jgi:integrase/recombinase XerD
MILQTQKRRKYVWHYRDHAIIYLMLTSGLSRQDIVHVKRRDYQFRSGEAILYLGYQEEKIEENFVKLASGAQSALDDYLSRRDDDNPYLFISHKKVSPTGHLSRTFFRYMFRQVLKDTGLEGSGITPHCLRHTAATFNLLRGGTLSQTKSFMRHVDIKSTMVYQDYVERMQDQTEYELEAFLLKEEVTEYDGDLISLLNILFE